MTRCLKALVACAALAATFLGSGSVGAASAGRSPLTSTMHYAAAALPHLSFPCTAPDSGAIVTCRLSGAGFQPRERLRILYRVDVTAAGGGHSRSAYRRTALTDGRGSFTRPVFRFHVDPRVLIYRATAAVAGARGDRATITAAGMP